MDILAGTPGIDITQKYGKLKITFETQNTSNDLLWPINLGTGLTSRDQIPCRGLDGLIPASGSEIECILVPAASAGVGNLVTIEVINFKKIAKGTAATLDIPKLTNS